MIMQLKHSMILYMLLQIHELLLPRRKLQVKADQGVEEYYSQCSFGTDGDEKSFLTTWTDGKEGVKNMIMQ